MDTIGGFAGYNSNKKYLHLAIDFATRYLWTMSSKTQTAKDFINLINAICQIQKPKMILAERYPSICSKELSHYLENRQIKLLFIASNYAPSNGISERVNQTIVTRLRCKMNENKNLSCWSKLLKTVTEEYNNSPHSVTGFTPKYLMFGILPFDYILGNPFPAIEEARKLAFKNSQKGHIRNKGYFDNKHQNIVLKPGDLVLIENKNSTTRKKFEPLMSGPFKVINKISNVMYEIGCEKKGRSTDLVHISKLRLYNEPHTKSTRRGDVE